MVQAEVLPHVQPIVPAKYWPWVTLGFAVAIMVLRNLAQSKLHAPPPEAEPRS
jgi:hypothetical protein